MTELLGLSYSPWTEKARFALDVRKVDYRYRTYAPLTGELALRRKLGKWRGAVSVPVLTTDVGEVIADSADIARWADARGDGPPLFPAKDEDAISRFIALSERGLEAGRGLSLLRMQDDPEALREMVPRRLRSALGPLATPLGRFGVRRTLRKYGAHRLSREALLSNCGSVLDELRVALSPLTDGEARCLLGQFTFADIAMAQVLAFVEPAPFGVKLGARSRACFTDEALRQRYADLLRWRDALYEQYRPKNPEPARPTRG